MGLKPIKVHIICIPALKVGATENNPRRLPKQYLIPTMIIQTVNIVTQLARRFNLKYANIYVDRKLFNIGPDSGPGYNRNPYIGTLIGETTFRDVPVASGALGNPVFTNVVFKGGKYTDHITGVEHTYPDIELQTVLLSVSQAKKIVKTEIQGRDGTVKEYIGMDDYKVTINAIINGTNGHYPVEDIAALKQMLDAPVTIDVTCKYLETLGIHAVVVEGYEINQEEGMYSQQKITINCCSDTAILLQSLQF
jgi:hypothetical protein